VIPIIDPFAARAVFTLNNSTNCARKCLSGAVHRQQMSVNSVLANIFFEVRCDANPSVERVSFS